MDIVDLEPSQRAPDESDRITLSRLPSGKYAFAGVVAQGTVTAHFFDHGAFETANEARAAGIAWAEEKQVEMLLVEHLDA